MRAQFCVAACREQACARCHKKEGHYKNRIAGDEEMKDEIYRQIPLFEQFNGLAHKRKTINVGHPAIIWHQAYWKPNKMVEKSWHYEIDRYLLDLKIKFLKLSRRDGDEIIISGGVTEIEAATAHLGANQLQEYYGEGYRPDLSASYFRLRNDQLKLTVAIEKFDEFWSCKIVIDLSCAEKCDSIPEWLIPLREKLCEAEEILVSRYNLNNKVNPSDDAAARASLDEKTAKISFAISSALYRSSKELLPEIEASPDGEKITSLDFIFVNFVGISLGIDIGAPGAEKASRFGSKEAENIIDNIMPRRHFIKDDVGDISNLVDAAWPLVKGINPYVKYDEGELTEPPDRIAVQGNAEKREFTTSLLNRGRSMYVTSLGGVRYRDDEKVAFPLSYLIISPHRATWQIGRIVDRIHSLGLFRMATFRDYETVEHANDRLSELGKSINDPEKRTGDISREFSSILQLTPDGLVNRIEWSRYYLKLFNETMSRLRFERVEGYQTYTEFVSRRLSTRFFIIEDAWSRIGGLSRQIRARTAEDTGLSIKDLLGFAEKVSIVPFAYYLHYVMRFANEKLLEIVSPSLHINVSVDAVWFFASAVYAVWMVIVLPRWRARNGK